MDDELGFLRQSVRNHNKNISVYSVETKIFQCWNSLMSVQKPLPHHTLGRKYHLWGVKMPSFSAIMKYFQEAWRQRKMNQFSTNWSMTIVFNTCFTLITSITSSVLHQLFFDWEAFKYFLRSIVKIFHQIMSRHRSARGAW